MAINTENSPIIFKLKNKHMKAKFPFPGRRRRKWVSYAYCGCLYDEIVLIVMRCPVINCKPVTALSWQHKIVHT